MKILKHKELVKQEKEPEPLHFIPIPLTTPMPSNIYAIYTTNYNSPPYQWCYTTASTSN